MDKKILDEFPFFKKDGMEASLVKVKLLVLNPAQNITLKRRTPISGSHGGARALKPAIFDLTL